jgi:hypothetical protein
LPEAVNSKALKAVKVKTTTTPSHAFKGFLRHDYDLGKIIE